MDLRDHVIHSRNGKLTGDTSSRDVSQIITAALDNTAGGGLVFHFHGGLVNKEAGLEIAGHLGPKYMDAGAYPVFCVWEAGLFENIKNNLVEIAKEQLFNIIRQRVLKMVKRKLTQNPGQRSGQELPTVSIDEELAAIEATKTGLRALSTHAPAIPEDLNELSQFEQMQLEEELLHDDELMRELVKVSQALLSPAEIEQQRSARSGTVRASSATLMDADAIEAYIERPAADERGIISTAKLIKAVVKIAVIVIKRFITDRDHGFHATIVEEILRALYVGNAGGIVWSTMKKDTFDHFGPDRKQYAGTAILHEIAEHMKTHETPPKITLVGHSTGAVFISAFLEAADAMLPPEAAFDVIYLAPAATMELTAKTLKNQGHRIRNLRMFTMTDENEKADALVNRVEFLYPCSLLYFVSGVVEDEIDMPLTGMQRFYDADRFPDQQFPELTPVRLFMRGDRVIWSVDDRGPGKRCAAVDHGEFDNETNTIDSIQSILENGF